MRKLIENLPDGSRVLDVGAGAGSFPLDRAGVLAVRVDLEIPARRPGACCVIADAARLPFRDAAFDLVISNHSLEHFIELREAVRETGRVLQRDAGLYVAVPDAGTLTDRIYRWLARGGGHVNAFRSPEEVIQLVEPLTGLVHRGTRALYSSLSFLNRHNRVHRAPRKIALFGFGHEGYLAVFTWLLRAIDRRFMTGLSRYGWSFYFGSISPPAEPEWINVCVRCGSGHSEALLRAKAVVERRFGVFETYRCPECRGFNLLTREQSRHS
jgi:SAM-dependent methyltransferase